MEKVIVANKFFVSESPTARHQTVKTWNSQKTSSLASELQVIKSKAAGTPTEKVNQSGII
jgi:hypothetical protein